MSSRIDLFSIRRDKNYTNTSNNRSLKIPRYKGIGSTSIIGNVGNEPGMEGDIILDRSTKQFCYHNGITWICLSDSGDVTTTLTSAECSPPFSPVNEVDLVANGTGPNLVIKKINGGAGILLEENDTCINIVNAGAGAITTLTSIECSPPQSPADEADLVVDGTGPFLEIRKILAGEGISLDTDTGCLRITNTGVAQDITLSGLACSPAISPSDEINLVVQGTGPDLVIRNLNGGFGIDLDDASGCVNITNTDPGSGVTLTSIDCNPPFSPPDEVDLVVVGTGPDLEIRKIHGGVGIELDIDNDCVNITNISPATDVTLVSTECSPELSPSNEIDLVASGSGPNLEIYRLNGGDGITLSIENNCVNITNTGIGSMTTLSSIDCSPPFSPADEVDLVVVGTGPNLEIRKIVAGDGIELDTDTGCVRITNTGSIENITLTGLACSGPVDQEVDLVVDGTGPDLVIRNIASGSGINLDTSAGCLEISSTVNLSTVFCSPAFSPSNEVSLVANGSGPDLLIYSLNGGDGIELNTDNDCVNIINTSPATSVTLSSIACDPPFSPPDEIDLVVTGTGPDLEIRKIHGGDGILLDIDNDCLNITNIDPGSAVTLTTLACSPPGANEINLVVDGSGPDLQIRGLNGGTGITLDTTDGCVTINADAMQTITLSGVACSPAISPANEVDLVVVGTGPDLEIRNLNGGDGILLDIDNNCVNITNTDPGSAVTLTTLACSPPGANEVDLVVDGSGPDLQIRGLNGGTGITLDTTDGCVTISADTQQITLSGVACSPAISPSNEIDLVVVGTGPDLEIRNLNGGDGILLDIDNNCVNITNTDPGSAVTLTTLACSPPGANEINLVVDGSGPDLQIRGLNGGTGITLDTTDGCVTINADAMQTITLSGVACSPAISPSNEVDLVVVGTGPDLEIRNLNGGDGILLDIDNNCVNITNTDPGSAVTLTTLACSPPGANEVDLVVGGSGPDLQIRGLNGGTGITLDTTDGCVTINADAMQTITLSGVACSPAISPSNEVDLVVVGTGPDLEIRNLNGGDGILLDIDNNCVNITNTDPGSAVTLTTLACSPPGANEVDLVVDGSGPDLQIRGLNGGTGITLDTTDGCVTINADAMQTITLSGVACSPAISPANEVDLVVVGTGPDLEIRNLNGGDGILLDIDNNCVNITNTDPGSAVTLTTLACSPPGANEINLVVDGSGPDLQIRGLNGGTGITLDTTDGCVTINADITLSGVACSPAISPSNEVDLVVVGTGPDLEIRNLNGGDGILLDIDNNCVNITNTDPGSSVTLTTLACSPPGANEVDLVVDGSGPDLQIRGLNGGTGITLVTTDGCVTINADTMQTITLTGVACSPAISPANEIDLVVVGTGPDLEIRNLNGGDGILLDIDNNCVNITNTDPGSAVTLTTLACSPPGANEINLVVDGSGPDLQIRGLNGGTGITLDTTDGCVTINADAMQTITLTGVACSPAISPANEVDLVVVGTGPDLEIRNLNGGDGILLDIDNNCVNITNTDPGSAVTLTTLACSPPGANEINLVVDGSGPDLQIRGLNGGTGITLDTTDGCVTINADAMQTITLTGVACSPAISPANEVDLVVVGTGPDLEIRNLNGGDGILLDIDNNCVNITNTDPGSAVTLTTLACSPPGANEVDLVVDGSGPDLQIRGLNGGTGITLDTTDGCVTINADAMQTITLTGVACSPAISPTNEVDLVVVGTGPDLEIRNLNGGDGILLDIDNNCVNITNTDPGSAVTLTTLACSPPGANEVDLVVDGSGPDLQIRGLNGGTGITLDTTDGCVTINADITLSGVACSPAISPANEVDLVVVGTGPDLEIRNLNGGDGILLDTNNNCVNITNTDPGSAVTLTTLACSPPGANEVDLVVDGSGPDLQIRGLNGGTGITLDTTDGCVTINADTQQTITLSGVACSPAISPANEVDLVVVGTGPDLEIRNLNGGDGILLDIDNNCVNITNTDPGSAVTLTTLACSPPGANEVDLVVDGSGPDLQIRGLNGGTGITLDTTDGCVNISATVTTLSGVACDPPISPANEIDLVVTGTGPNLEIRNLNGGDGISLDIDNDCVNITNTDPGSAVTLTTLACSPPGANEVDLVVDGSGPDLQIRGLNGGTGITLDTTDGCVTISADALQTITLTGVACSPAISPANEVDLVVVGTGPDLEIRNLNGGDGILLDTDNNCVNITNTDPGSAVTLTTLACSPPGANEVDLVVDGSGPDLQIRGLNGGTGITLDTTDGCVNISAVVTTLSGVACNPPISPANEIDLVVTGTGPDLEIRNLNGGDGITLDIDNDCVNITNSDPGSAVTLTSLECSPAFSPSDEIDLVVDGSGPDLIIRKLNGGDGIDLDIDNGCVNIKTTAGGGGMMYNFPFTADGNTPYVNIPNSTTYSDMCTFIFRGSDIDNVSVAKVIIETGNRAADLRIYDGTNTLFSVTVPTSSTRAIFTMTLGTIPASEALVSLQARRSTTTGGQNPKLYSLMMY